ncbi:MAG: glycerol-3-phosphate dehydrogenase/oxidase [Rhodanobacteraceae bacterium]
MIAAIAGAPHAQVLILGGGINGIGTFRDLALQGVDVVLVERNDFASGASAASSHMIHGGLRYLENGEMRLVRQSVHERNRLLELAPHYVKPLRTTIPIFSTFAGLAAAPWRLVTHRRSRHVGRGAILVKLGLLLYDAFSHAGGTLPRHVFHGTAATHRELPCLNPAVKYTATYFDASVQQPERLALDVLLDGLAAGAHARAANYVGAVGADAGGIRLRDTLSGAVFTISADLVINATGPWTDLTNALLGESTRYMGGTKGSHIVLDQPELLEACAGREIFFENSDGRIVLIYPLRGKVMVGTTDVNADVRTPARCTDAEIDYFIELVARVFPDIPIDRSRIVYRFSGVRPLPHHAGVPPGSVSRDWHIVPSNPLALGGTPVLSLVGGKFTTFRAVAEQLGDEALARLGMQRKVVTDALPIGGGRDFPMTSVARDAWTIAHGGALGSARVGKLLARYGTRAAQVIAFLERHGNAPLARTDAFTAGELAFMACNEYVVHLTDVLLRRTSVAFDGNVTPAVIDDAARVLADAFGWSSERTRAEVADARRVLMEEHGVALGAAGLEPPREIERS